MVLVYFGRPDIGLLQNLQIYMLLQDLPIYWKIAYPTHEHKKQQTYSLTYCTS